MHFVKRKNIDTYRPKGSRLAVEVDGREIMLTNKSLTIPVGTMAQRPANATAGMIRYCTDLTGGADFEVYTTYSTGAWQSSGWERMRTNRPAAITISNVGTGQGTGIAASVNIVSQGTGYSQNYPPDVVFRAPDTGTTYIVATATVSGGGAVTGFNVSNYGSGYISVPTVTVGIAWTNGGSGTNNKDYFYGNNHYKATAGGTFGSTPPTHTSGSVINGNVPLTYAGTVATATVTLTGTLTYNLPTVPYDNTGTVNANNVMIYVENVFQLPGINYTVVGSSPAVLTFDAPVPYGKNIYAIYGFDH
jgi:hypothetical protein